MRTLCLLFALGAVVGIRRGLDAASDPCAEDGNFPCVAAGKTTDDIADAALKLEKLYAGESIGTCKVFVQLVVNSLGGDVLGQYYRNAYCNCGYEVLDPADVVRGDIIQISHDLRHEGDADEDHLHTAIVLENRGAGWFDVIESNWHLDLKIGTREGDERWNPQQWADTWTNWSAHFYRLAPPPGGPPPYPVNSIFAGRDAGLGFAISPAYDGSDGVYQDFKTGRLFFDGTWGTITIRAYPNGVGPGWIMSGWDDTTSLAFARRYGQLIQKHHGNRLGFPFDDGAGAYVRLIGVLGSQALLQTFRQPTPPNFGSNGQGALVIDTEYFAYLSRPTAVHIQGEFWQLYRTDPSYYGVPVSEQGIWVDYAGGIDPARKGYIYLRQEFDDHHSMLWHPGETVKFILSPDNPPCWPGVCTDVGGGSDPLTLTGWAVSNRQVYLRSSGGVELDQHGYRAWYVNGTYHSTTYTPELTIIGLEPGVTYTFRTEQVQNDVVETVSTDLTLTLPPAEEFSLHVELRMANAVSLSITNRRFVVVGYYRLLRDGVEITKLSGEAASDFDLEYSRTYTYEVVAMTASHMELGRTGAVAITTQPQPVIPQPPPDPARPTSIVLTTDRAEIPAFTKTLATAPVSDQYGRAMVGLQVLYLSSNPAIASIHADTGEIIAESVGTVQFHAELYDDRNLWSPLVTFTVQRADWTPPIPPVWHVIVADQPLPLDASGRHWSNPQHEAWSRYTGYSNSVQRVTLPYIPWVAHPHYQPQHYELGNPVPVDGFTWYPADGRLGVYFKALHNVEAYVNGQKVGEWGRVNDYGTQPINLPELGTVNNPSITLPPVEITPYLVAGTNYLVLHITAGSGAPELKHLEFVKLSGDLAPPPALPNLVCELTPESATVTADDQAVFGVKVKNLSPTACPASLLSLSVDGALPRTFTIPELAASASHSFFFTLDRLAEGVHTVAIVADSEQQIAESDENNGATLSFTVAPTRRPDLLVSALDIPAQGFIGELLLVTITVPNLGDAPSAPCLLNLGFGGTSEESIYDSEPGQLQFIVPELAPGAEVSFISSLRLAEADTFTLWADVDANAEISESNEANNLASASFTIVPLPPNLVVSGITMTPVSPTTTDVVRFITTVQNTSQSASAECHLTGTVNLLQFGFWGNLPTVAVPALAPGASVDVIVTGGPFPIPIPHFVLFTADGANVISELKEDDNQKSIAFTVTDSRSDLVINWVKVTRRDSSEIRYEVEIGNPGGSPVSLYDADIQGFLSRDTVFYNSDDRGAGGTILALSGYLNPGQKMTKSWYCTLSPAVDYTIYQYLTVKVDWSNKIVESNEANNTAYTAVALVGTTLFSDNLESGLAKWRLNVGASGSTPLVSTRSSPYGGKTTANGTSVMYLGDSTSGTFATATAEFTVNLTGYTQAVLEFDWSTYSLYSPEFLAVDLYDGTWRLNLATTVAAGWRHVSVDLSKYRLTSGVVIRFRSYQDWPESSDAAYVDNVKLTAK